MVICSVYGLSLRNLVKVDNADTKHVYLETRGSGAENRENTPHSGTSIQKSPKLRRVKGCRGRLSIDPRCGDAALKFR